MKADEVWRCCLCGEYFTGWGNNPWPLVNTAFDRCCDACNAEKVIPARLERMNRKENKNGNQT